MCLSSILHLHLYISASWQLVARLSVLCKCVCHRPIVYWVFAGSCIAYSCCSLANSVLPASVVSAYTCLQPIVGVLFSWILNGEALAWRDLGGVLIIAGLLLTSLGARDGDGDGDEDEDEKTIEDDESSASVFRLPTTRPLASSHARPSINNAAALGQLQGPLLPNSKAGRDRLSMSGDL